MTTGKGLFGTSLARKYWMALTGLFLCTFLVIHLAGNLQLIGGTAEDFNAYSRFMTSFPLIKIVSYVLYLSIVLHAVDGLILARQNARARPVRYVNSRPSANSGWASRKMTLLGLITLLFLIIHMKSFWYEMHFGNLPMDAAGNKDLYTITVAAFQQLWYTAFYMVALLALALHLWHGFQSAFQSMGWNHPRYTPVVKVAGRLFAVIVPVLFASIPLYIYMNQ